jgi:hypothetical protein
MKSIIVLGISIITEIFGIAWMGVKLVLRFIVVFMMNVE